jgi:iron complex outermembrane receptor protein
MSFTVRGTRRLLLLSTTLLASAVAGHALAQDAAAPAQDTTDVSDATVKEIIVRAERSKAAATAPSKASLDQGEPQSIVSRPFIELSIPESADYTSIANVTPSASSAGASNGAGWGESKLVLRGFQDGEYNITYDGIAFADTNNPTHHSNSFFPASTIGATIVDRGPGEAGDLGQANFGGNVKLFSNKITDDYNVTLRETVGSFGGWQSVAVLQTGKVDALGGLKGFINLQANGAQGQQTYSPLHANNLTMKFALPVGETWTITAFATKNYNFAHQTDNGGATLAQVALYGKNFNLSNDPASSTYWGYNYITKDTNFEYLKETGDLPLGLKLDNTSYSYFYKNNTFTANDVTSADGVTNSPSAIGTFVTNTVAGGAKNPSNPNDIRGYNKLNEYHVLGDIARFTRDFSFGQLRFGAWLEKSSTNRHTYDYDATLGAALSVPDNREKAICTQYTYVANPDGTFTANCVKATQDTTHLTNVSYEEQSSWWQTNYFADFDWHVTDRLTITPGIKSVLMKRAISAPVIKSPRQPAHYYDKFGKTLDFLTVNYKLTKNWSVYSQYANGLLMPPINDLYVTDFTKNTAEPQTTTNYQYGTVFQSRHVAIDADIYRIDVNNLYQADATGNSFINAGHAYYRGFEGQVSYAFDNGVTLFANGSTNKTRNDQGNRITKAPKDTQGAGVLYNHGPWSGSLLFKRVGSQIMNTNPESWVVNPYNTMDVAGAYDFGKFKLKLQVSNLADHRAVDLIKPVNKTSAPSPFDQYYYQSGRNAQLTLIAKF